MPAPETHRGFSLRPYAASTRDGEVLSLSSVLKELKQDIINAQALAQWELDTQGARILKAYDNDPDLLSGPVNTTAALLGLDYSFVTMDDLAQGKSGRSRYHGLVFGEVVAATRSWHARVHAARGTSQVHVSRGFKRTARDTKPTMPYRLNLGYTSGGQYARWSEEHPGSLEVVINGAWVVLDFSVPARYDGKLGLPTVNLEKDGSISFRFVEKRAYQQRPISTRFVVGLDVGKVKYATISVWDAVEHRPVFHSTLSVRVASLWNSIQAAEAQKKALVLKGRKEEAALHRAAASRKKRELAIVAAQEMAIVAAEWGNAVVAVEDLGWVENTMANGRWNRGELVKWLEHFVTQNGSRVVRVNAARTSQACSVCGVQVVHSGRTVVCPACGLTLDRDVNASVNIAKRAVKSVVKMDASRRKSKFFVDEPAVRKSKGPGRPLKYPGRDRRKQGPTRRRPKKRVMKDLPSEGVKVALEWPPIEQGARVVGDGETRMTPGLVTAPQFGRVRVMRE